jgi:hypothetical protein
MLLFLQVRGQLAQKKFCRRRRELVFATRFQGSGCRVLGM